MVSSGPIHVDGRNDRRSRVLLPRGTRIRYGNGRHRFGVLHEAADPDAPVVVLVHGGFWRGPYNRWTMLLLVRDLVALGVSCFNVEYRRLGRFGGGGGYPETFDDVRDAITLMARRRRTTSDGTRRPLVVVGHSAGGHLALVAAADLSDEIDGVISLAGPTDLRRLVDDGSEPVGDLVQSAPEATRFEMTSPIEMLPLGVRVLCVHGALDSTVASRQSIRFVSEAQAAGDDARLEIVPDGTHRSALLPTSDTWRAARRTLIDWLRIRADAVPDTDLPDTRVPDTGSPEPVAPGATLPDVVVAGVVEPGVVVPHPFAPFKTGLIPAEGPL